MKTFIEVHEKPGEESKVMAKKDRRISVCVEDIVALGDKVTERTGVIDLATIQAEPERYALLVFRYNPVRPMAVSETYDEVLALIEQAGAAEIVRAPSELAAG